MRKVMVFQHVGHEPLGTLDPMLKAAGLRLRYVNFCRSPDTIPNLEGYDGLIVLGGPMGVYEAETYRHLKVEMQSIEEALKMNIPVLGICLGAQLLAATLGAAVKKASQMELGWYDVHLTENAKADPLFQSFKAKEKVFQLHQDTFAIPKSAKHLAWSEACEGQAFRYGENAYGLQFHLEADHAMIKRWMHRRENIDFMLKSHGTFDPTQIENETEICIHRSLDLSRNLFGRFIDLFQLPERGVLLGSEHAKPKKHKSG